MKRSAEDSGDVIYQAGEPWTLDGRNFDLQKPFVAAVASATRAAENDALERAAGMSDEMDDGGWLADKIRALKYKDPE